MLKRLDGTPVAEGPKIVEYLDSLADGIVVSTAELAQKMELATDQITKNGRRNSDLIARSIKVGPLWYWGSLVTIQREKNAGKS